jgi:hypothetical protein
MDEEIFRFRAELRLRAARDMCRRFLIFGSCMQLDDESYYGLKAAVAEQFQIHPNEIIVVARPSWVFRSRRRNDIEPLVKPQTSTWPSSRRSFSTMYGMKSFNISTPQGHGKLVGSCGNNRRSRCISCCVHNQQTMQLLLRNRKSYLLATAHSGLPPAA